MGPAEDPKFKETKETFEEAKKGLDKLQDHVTNYLGAESSLLNAQKKLSEDMASQYGNSNENNLVRQNLTLLEKMLVEKQKLDDELRREFLDPANKYKAQYRELDERMRERKRRMEEADKLHDQVKKYKEKSDARLSATEKRYDALQKGYEDLNAELMSDIPRLIADKEEFFHPLVAILLDSQWRFHQSMADKLNELRTQATNIDRKSVHSHPPVITPRQQSCVAKSYSSFAPGESAGVTPLSSATSSAANPSAGRAPPPTPARSQPAPPPRGARAKANWDFTTDDPNELPFRAGEILNIVTQSGEWWTAELNGRQGLIPANYVTMM